MTLKEALQIITDRTQAGTVDADLLGGLEFSEVLTELTALNSKALTSLDVGDDADANEEALRNVMQVTAVQCLLAGILVGRDTSPQDDTSVVHIEVSESELTDLAVTMLREGVVTFRISGTAESE